MRRRLLVFIAAILPPPIYLAVCVPVLAIWYWLFGLRGISVLVLGPLALCLIAGMGIFGGLSISRYLLNRRLGREECSACGTSFGTPAVRLANREADRRFREAYRNAEEEARRNGTFILMDPSPNLEIVCPKCGRETMLRRW